MRALRPYLAAAAVGALLALLMMGRGAGGIVAGGWVLLLLTVGLAMTSQKPQQPNTDDPRGRLHGPARPQQRRP